MRSNHESIVFERLLDHVSNEELGRVFFSDLQIQLHKSSAKVNEGATGDKNPFSYGSYLCL